MPDPTPSLNRTQALDIIEHLPDALVVIDAAQSEHYLNQAARQLLGINELPAHIGLDALSKVHGLHAVPLPMPLPEIQVFRLEPIPAGEEARSPQIAPTPGLPAADFGTLLDGLGIGLLVLDKQDRVAAANRTASTLVGRNKITMLHQELGWLLPDLNPQLTALKNGTIRHTPPFDHNHRRLVARLIPGETGRLLTLFDLSPFQTRDLERVGLLRFIVHDISNPLNIAINFADLMAEGVLDEDEHEQGTHIVAHQLHRILTLLEDLSLLDQVSEDIGASFVPVDVDVLAATVVNDLQDRASELHICLTTTPLPPDLCQTQGIGRLIQQAIHNLVENALKYTLPGGWVRVTVYTRDNWLNVLVTDNGIGIPPNKQSQIFHPFYRAKDPRTADVDGTGLGLSLVRMVAERHGGSVWYFSVPDKGSIFRLRLPCYRNV